MNRRGRPKLRITSCGRVIAQRLGKYLEENPQRRETLHDWIKISRRQLDNLLFENKAEASVLYNCMVFLKIEEDRTLLELLKVEFPDFNLNNSESGRKIVKRSYNISGPISEIEALEEEIRRRPNLIVKVGKLFVIAIAYLVGMYKMAEAVISKNHPILKLGVRLGVIVIIILVLLSILPLDQIFNPTNPEEHKENINPSENQSHKQAHNVAQEKENHKQAHNAAHEEDDSNYEQPKIISNEDKPKIDGKDIGTDSYTESGGQYRNGDDDLANAGNEKCELDNPYFLFDDSDTLSFDNRGYVGKEGEGYLITMTAQNGHIWKTHLNIYSPTYFASINRDWKAYIQLEPSLDSDFIGRVGFELRRAYFYSKHQFFGWVMTYGDKITISSKAKLGLTYDVLNIEVEGDELVEYETLISLSKNFAERSDERVFIFVGERSKDGMSIRGKFYYGKCYSIPIMGTWTAYKLYDALDIDESPHIK